MKAPKVSKAKIEQVIDLSEFGLDLSNERGLKESLGQAIIDQIVSRTEAGNGMRFSGGQGRPVKLKSPYSKQYVKSLPFKAAGKKKNDVNMKLTGDMLASIDVVSTEGNKIVIGIEGETEILKAFNHITGDTVPERPFFGVNKSEMRDIVDGMSSALATAGEGDSEDQKRRIRVLDLFSGGEGD